AALRRARTRKGQRNLSAKSRLEDERIQMFDDVTNFLRLTTPPGGDGGQEQFLTQQMSTQIRQEGEEGGTFHEPGTQSIGHRDVAGAGRLEETRHTEKRITAQFERIAEGIVDATEDDIHRLKALDRFQENVPIPDRQVGAFNEWKPE